MARQQQLCALAALPARAVPRWLPFGSWITDRLATASVRRIRRSARHERFRGSA